MDNFIEQIRHFFANCYLIAQDVYRERVWPNIIRTVESLSMADDNSIKGEINEMPETRNENVYGPHSTINYFALMDQEVPSGILTRWQLLQMAEKKQPPPPIRRPQQKPKPLICSRRLFTTTTERSISRASHSNMVAEMDEEDVDFDSVSQTSGLMTPFSSIVDPTKINNLEQQVALLQKQMAQLMAQQGTSSSAKLHQKSPPLPSSLPNKPTPAMGPPPPPPLLPSFREELLNRKKPPNSNVVLDNNKLNGVKKSPSPPLQQHQGPTKMGDVLKAIGTVKLKKVNRESPSGPMAKSRKKLQLENDKTVAGILARAMDDRRKKVKLDSEDMEEDQLNKSRPKDGGGDWSDEEDGEKENNNNKIVMENGHGIGMDDKENMKEELEVVEDAFAL